MIKNHLKVAIRSILRHKGTSALNILGLAIGIASSILITLFVVHELSFDKFHENADNIYRVAIKANIGNTQIHQIYSSAITFQKLMDDYPETVNGVRFDNMGRTPIKLDDKTFYETRVMAVDSTFFEMFTFPLIHGDKSSVLTEPNTLVLTESMAKKYFNKTNVVGQTLGLDLVSYGKGVVEFKIVGVAKDFPINSHFHIDLILSIVSFPEMINETGWTANNFRTYIQLQDGVTKAEFDEKLIAFTRKYMGGEQFDAWVEKGNSWEYYLQPITGIHLDSDITGEFEANGDRNYVYLFSIVSIIILLIASINFMNLATAKSSLRAKEVSMRKVVGAGRNSLVSQFLSESIVISYISLFLGLLLAHALLPFYNTLVDRHLTLEYFNNPWLIPILLISGLVIGVFSGSYPAFFLSAFKITTVLNQSTGTSKSGSWIRNALVIFQFSISIVLITSTIIVYSQLQYLQTKKLGFNKEQILNINNPGILSGERLKSFKDNLLQQTYIKHVSGSNFLPGQGYSNIGFGAEEVEDGFALDIGIVDENYAKTLELEMAIGRFFDPAYKSDSAAVIINESAHELIGWEDPIGKKMNNWSKNRGNFTVIGVVKDFHYQSLHQEVKPMALFLDGGYYDRIQRNISLKLNTADVASVIATIEGLWKKEASGLPFEYSFLDEDFSKLYMNEQQTKKIFTVFSVLAIFIACLGLFGLASFITDQKTKEIGLRKVLGASAGRLINMLNANFVKWVLISSVFAWPVAWFVMNRWLQNFAYRIDVAWWMFVVAALLTLVISLLVVSMQTVKAALKNPVDAIKHK